MDPKLAFAVSRRGYQNLFSLMSGDGSGQPKRLTANEQTELPDSLARQRTTATALIVEQDADIFTLDLRDRQHTMQPLVDTRFDEKMVGRSVARRKMACLRVQRNRTEREGLVQTISEWRGEAVDSPAGGVEPHGHATVRRLVFLMRPGPRAAGTHRRPWRWMSSPRRRKHFAAGSPHMLCSSWIRAFAQARRESSKLDLTADAPAIRLRAESYRQALVHPLRQIEVSPAQSQGFGLSSGVQLRRKSIGEYPEVEAVPRDREFAAAGRARKPIQRFADPLRDGGLVHVVETS